MIVKKNKEYLDKTEKQIEDEAKRWVKELLHPDIYKEN